MLDLQPKMNMMNLVTQRIPELLTLAYLCCSVTEREERKANVEKASAGSPVLCVRSGREVKCPLKQPRSKCSAREVP